MKNNLIIGTRQSKLALKQTELICNELRARYPDCNITIRKIISKGDKIKNLSLFQIDGKKLFTEELEEELLRGRIDVIVHSLKDLSTELDFGLCLAAITERINHQDAFVSNKYMSFKDLPPKAIVGTSSLRRKVQLAAQRPDLIYRNLRGNIDTRLKKLDRGQFDAIILAAAGLERLNLQKRIKELFPDKVCLSAAGQGSLGLETRTKDMKVKDMLSFLNSPTAEKAIKAERAFMKAVDGGCHAPIGVYAEICGSTIKISAAMALTEDGALIKKSLQGPVEKFLILGEHLGKIILEEVALSSTRREEWEN